MKKILFATTNQGKLKEIRSILADLDCEIVSLKDAGITTQVEENGTTFEENAKIKATAFAKESGLITLADDSGLEVDYMDKAPGVYSARFLGEDTSYDVKNMHIIDKLSTAKEEERTARFVCAICCAMPDGTVYETKGVIEGMIAYEPAGENGFGYDPIFYVPEFGKTTAQLSPEQKNKISHRGLALEAMKNKLVDEGCL
ncbi:MAG: XTP/dITP diphosphatase [Lachnospiraceae bacterium]|nr:XTP/dITP diphosphatase [Lachnospiraceae bacterium]